MREVTVPTSPRSGAARALRQSGIISLADLALAEQVAKDRKIALEQAAVSLGMLSDDQVLYLVAETHGIDLVFPSPDNVDRELLARFPVELLRRHAAVPLIVDGDCAVVAFAEVPDAAMIEEFAHHAGIAVRPVLASARRLENTLHQVLGGSAVDAVRASAQDISGMTAFYRYLTAAFGGGADELRFEPAAAGVGIRVRRNGILRDEGLEPACVGPGIATRARLLAKLPPSTSPQTAELVAHIVKRDVALSLAIVPGSAGELVVLARRNVLPAEIPMEDCGLAPDVLDWLRGPFCAPPGRADSATGLVIVASTDSALLHAFVRGIVDRMDRANAFVCVTKDVRFGEREYVRIPPGESGVGPTVRSAGGARPDVLFVDGGEAADGVAEAAFVAAGDARVIFGMVDPNPQGALAALLAAHPSTSRVHRVLEAVVCIDQCRAPCMRCSAPDPGDRAATRARIPAGCDECDGCGRDGVVVIAAGVRANRDTRADHGTPVDGSILRERTSARLRDLVTGGRIGEADARARMVRLERP